MNLVSQAAPAGASLTLEEVRDLIRQACPPKEYSGKKVLLIVPDATRTAPVGWMFQTLHKQVAEATAAFDVLVALGTHQPMSDAAICNRLEITEAQRQREYRGVRFFNHSWDKPETLRRVGVIPAADIAALSGGLFAMDVPVDVNRLIFDYDQIIIVGPVFPHEVVGFSGGNKYLFPGVAGPEILNFFHWLGAVVTNPMIIGNKWTPVRKVVDRAGAMVPLNKLCFCMVVAGQDLSGLYIGSPEDAWDAASDHSRKVNIAFKDRPFHTILSCAPKMYDELWTGGKCMYKLEPVLADGGELIIYAPHITEVCVTHHKTIMAVGYHCSDYFIKQWDKFKHFPWGVLAHSSHVHGIGKFENGVETPRARVTLATGITPEVCRQINLGYRDPATIDPKAYADREHEGVLYVPKAGEILYQLKNPPRWAGGN